MVKFKKTFYKIVNEGNKLSIRFANYRADVDYIYDAFKTKDGDDDYMYIAAYPGSKRLDIADTIISASSDIPLNETIEEYREKVRDNYEILAYDKYKFIYGLLVLVTKSMDFNQKIGTAAESAIRNGTMNKKGLFFGSPNPDEGNKIFGLENMWTKDGNIVEGLLKYNDTLYYKSAFESTDDLTGYRPLNTIGLVHDSGYVSAMASDRSYSIIYPTELNGSSSTYFTSYYHSPSAIDDNIHHFVMGSLMNEHSHLINMRSDINIGGTRLTI